MLQRGGVCCSVVECVAVFCEAAVTCHKDLKVSPGAVCYSVGWYGAVW